MKSLALRFGENFAPSCGTIKAHEEVLLKYGYVWYGKFGNHLSNSKTDALMKEVNPKVLLIHSGTSNRYWAYLSEISDKCEELDKVPSYYRDRASTVKTWLKFWKIERAKDDVIKHCKLSSNNEPLANVSKGSISPFFFIDYYEDINEI